MCTKTAYIFLSINSTPMSICAQKVPKKAWFFNFDRSIGVMSFYVSSQLARSAFYLISAMIDTMSIEYEVVALAVPSLRFALWSHATITMHRLFMIYAIIDFKSRC